MREGKKYFSGDSFTFSAGRFLWKLRPVEATPRNLRGCERCRKGARWFSVNPTEPKNIENKKN